MFESTQSPGSALPAGRGMASEQELRELWACTEDGETDWFADYDPELVSDQQIVEMMADIMGDDDGAAADATGDDTAGGDTATEDGD